MTVTHEMRKGANCVTTVFRPLTQIRGIHRRTSVKFASASGREYAAALQGQFITPGLGIAGTTNQRLPNLLLVIDRLFIQMNADYRGGFSMLRQLAGAMNKLLPGARAPVLSVVPLQGPFFLNNTRRVYAPEYQIVAVLQSDP